MSSKVDAILSFSAKFSIITAGDRMIAGSSKLWPVRDWIWLISLISPHILFNNQQTSFLIVNLSHAEIPYGINNMFLGTVREGWLSSKLRRGNQLSAAHVPFYTQNRATPIYFNHFVRKVSSMKLINACQLLTMNLTRYGFTRQPLSEKI